MLNTLITRIMLVDLKREDGQAMAEYGLILALVAVAVLLTLGALGTSIGAKIGDVVTSLGGTLPS